MRRGLRRKYGRGVEWRRKEERGVEEGRREGRGREKRRLLLLPLHCSVLGPDWSIAKGGHSFSITFNKQSMHYNSNIKQNYLPDVSLTTQKQFTQALWIVYV